MKLFITFIYMTITGQACFWVGLILPRNLFLEDKFPFKAFRWEKNGSAYDALKVKKWKTKVPDMSKITGLIFPKRLRNNMTSADFDRLVKESCIAELSHYVLFILSYGIYQIWRGKTGLILLILYNLIGNVPYIIIQRYNRPHFIKVRDRLKIREEKHSSAHC